LSGGRDREVIDPERVTLVRIAQKWAAERTWHTFDNTHTLLIGGTQNDVPAALSTGVQVIGVVTGKTNAGACANLVL
jgi:hypothetical protein